MPINRSPIDQQLDSIEFRHVPEQYQAVVRDWYAGRVAALKRDGDRSVHLPHPDGGGRVLKLKGAGLRGRGVEFGAYHQSGPKAPVFDFDGRMMHDIASGHDNAFRGGASFQQAATEYRVAQRLTQLGYATVPCLGYGRIEKDGRVSWFSLFDHEPGLSGDMAFPKLPLALWIALNREIGDLMFELAVAHDLIGYCWYSRTPDGRLLIRDVHPFRLAEPYGMSQLSWVMQLLWVMQIRGNTQRLRAEKWNEPDMPADLHVWQYRAFCPDVRLEDHDDLRHQLIAPYMLAPPADFSIERLVALLKGNRISAALLEACPAKFARL